MLLNGRMAEFITLVFHIFQLVWSASPHLLFFNPL